MLEALPAGEAAYYGDEGNVIDWHGKCQVHLDELHSQYSFFGGSFEEVLKYFHRGDLPKQLWQWRLYSETKTTAGMSTVLKKDGISQRKLLMSVPFNYLAQDVKECSNLGMTGGGALARVHTSETVSSPRRIRLCRVCSLRNRNCYAF